jgi:hypothetical protein
VPIVINDESVVATLSATSSPEEVRAPDGRVLGQFIPARTTKMTFPELGMTDEELDRRVNRPDARWYTAEEVMERLRQLRKAN